MTRTADEIYSALDWLGCDVKKIVTVDLHECPFCGTLCDRMPQEAPPRRCEICGTTAEVPFPAVASDEVIQIDLLPARPDILDTGGLARALRGFFRTALGLPDYRVDRVVTHVDVDPALLTRPSYRPVIAAAMVDCGPIDPDLLREIMRLQENLHWAVGRGRKLCSIGFYDAATVCQPFLYGTVDPARPLFVPLGSSGGEQWSPDRILTEHSKGVAFAHLLEGFSRYPILRDSNGAVLSMPPIINSERTRVRVGTERLFIDVTGMEAELVERCLAIIVSSLLELGATRVSAVEIRYPEERRVTPDLTPRRSTLNLERTCRRLGFELAKEEFVQLLGRMRNDVAGEGPDFEIIYPAYRADIKHEVDLMEDVAIGYGFDQISQVIPSSMTFGHPLPDEERAAKTRTILLGLGYLEIVTFMLVDPASYQRMPSLWSDRLVKISNPKSVAQGAIRCSLFGGLLDTLERNNHRAVPQRLFEVGRVVMTDDAAETGARDAFHVAFAAIGPDTGFAESRSAVDALTREIGIGSLVYRPSEHPSLLPGRGAEVFGSDGSFRGVVGEVHPRVLSDYALQYPVGIAEIVL